MRRVIHVEEPGPTIREPEKPARTVKKPANRAVGNSPQAIHTSFKAVACARREKLTQVKNIYGTQF